MRTTVPCVWFVILPVIADNETLVRLGTSGLTSLITLNLNHMTSSQLDYLCAALHKLFDGTLPSQLLEYHAATSSADGAGAAHPGASAASAGPSATVPTSVADQEAALVAPPSVLAVLVDPADESGADGPGSAISYVSPEDVNALRERRSSSSATALLLSTASAARPAANETLQHRFQTIVSKCTLQLLLIQTVNDLLYRRSHERYRALGPVRLLDLAKNLERSYAFANAFNRNQPLRRDLAAAGTRARREGAVTVIISRLVRTLTVRRPAGLGRGARVRTQALSQRVPAC